MRIAIIILFLLPITGISQTTFAPVGAKWTYTQQYVWNWDTTIFRLESVGDTLIQGRLCSKLVHEGSLGCMYVYEHVTTVGDTVMFHDPVDDEFRILYIIGGAVGSSWPTILSREMTDVGGTIIYHDTLWFTVMNMDTIIIEGVELRRIHVDGQAIWGEGFANAPFSGVIIERLGHLGYLFPWIDGACDMEVNNPLRCYEDPLIQWLNPQYPQCELSVGMSELDAPVATILPTLLTVGEVLMIIPATSKTAEYAIHDVIGKLLEVGTLNGSTTIQLERAGIYHLTLWVENGNRQHQRVVVQ